MEVSQPFWLKMGSSCHLGAKLVAFATKLDKVAAKLAEVGSGWPQVGPNSGQVPPKLGKNRSKLAPDWPKIASRLTSLKHTNSERKAMNFHVSSGPFWSKLV